LFVAGRRISDAERHAVRVHARRERAVEFVKRNKKKVN